MSARGGEPAKIRRERARAVAAAEQQLRWAAAALEREQVRQARVEENRRVAAPIVAELVRAGYAVDSISDLYNRRMDYRGAIPILLRWLPRVTNLDIKEDIVRALSVKWARPSAGPALVAAYRETPTELDLGLKWAIANALSVVADDSIGDDVIELSLDRSGGRAREMLAFALAKLKNPKVAETLRALLADEEMAGHAVVGLGKLRRPEYRADIEPFLNHPKAWVRQEAKRALAKMERAEQRKTAKQ